MIVFGSEGTKFRDYWKNFNVVIEINKFFQMDLECIDIFTNGVPKS